MRHFVSAIAWFVFFSVLFVDQGRTEEKAATDAVNEAVKLELLEAGTSPRKIVRFAPKQGAKQTAVMTMRMSQTLTMGGQKIPSQNIPATKVTIATTIDKVLDNGDIAFDFSYTDIDIVADPANPSPLDAIMKSMMTPLVGAKGSGVVTSRGFTKKSEIMIPEGVPDQLKKVMDGMKNAMNQISSPIPAEPIGVGAKWQVTQELKANGLEMNQVTVHEMTKLDENEFTMNVTLTQDAQPQEIKNDALPVGSKLELKSLKSTGTGKTTIELGSILPVFANVLLNSQTAMSVDVAGQTQAMTTDMDMEMTMESVR